MLKALKGGVFSVLPEVLRQRLGGTKNVVDIGGGPGKHVTGVYLFGGEFKGCCSCFLGEP